MAKVEWDTHAWDIHQTYALGLYIEFGNEAMMDYLRLVDEAIDFIGRYPLAGSPTISNFPNRRVKLTSQKEYQVHYDFHQIADKAIVVAVFK